jgi:hypothetical protein
MASDWLMTSTQAHLSDADPRILDFLNAWRAARRGNEIVPLKKNFDPMRVPTLLQFMWLYRFDPSNGNYLCRLAGEEVNAAWGYSIKGKSLAQIVGPVDYPTVLKRWHMITNTPLVQYGTARERLTEQTTQQAERMLVPLKDTSGATSYVLGVSLYRYVNFEPVHIPPLSGNIVRIACADIG